MGLQQAIDYMEEHLFQKIGAEEVADALHFSPFYFQKCFKIVTGYTIGEYLRNRILKETIFSNPIIRIAFLFSIVNSILLPPFTEISATSGRKTLI